LHYYFLSAVRRDVLVTGKYLSGLVTSIILFTTVTVMCLPAFLSAFLFRQHAFFLDGAGWVSCLPIRHHDSGLHRLRGVLSGRGLFFRNPIIPAMFLYGWEWLNFLLPPL